MTHRTKIIFLIATLYLIGSVGSFVFMSVQVDNVGTLLEERVQLIADQYVREQKYSELSALVERTKSEREQLSQYLLSESDTVTFLADIEQIGLDQGVELSTLSLDVVEVADAANELNVRFGVVGNETTVRHVLTILESLPYQSTLTDLQLVRDDAADLTVTVKLALQ